MSSITDYVNTHFGFPVLTRIHGEPTFASITTLQEQLMANAMTVVSDLGGGAHGHLGAVLNPVDYGHLSNESYVVLRTLGH